MIIMMIIIIITITIYMREENDNIITFLQEGNVVQPELN